MKTRNIFFKALTVLFFMALTTALPAQNPPPPPGVHGETGNQTPPGGGVPVGSGLVILLALGAAYGGKKVYEMRKSN
jgi:hypothetical protein